MRGTFDNGYLDTLFCQILSHLQTDEAGTDHSAGNRFVVGYIIMDRIGVRDISQREYMVFLDARKIRKDWSSARREHQLVIRFFVGFFTAFNGYDFLFCVDCDHFIAGSHINVKTLVETRWCLQL